MEQNLHIYCEEYFSHTYLVSVNKIITSHHMSDIWGKMSIFSDFWPILTKKSNFYMGFFSKNYLIEMKSIPMF